MTHRTTWARQPHALDLAAVLLALLLGLVLHPTTAQAGTITAGDPTTTSADPKSIVFKIRVQAPAGLQTATLDYKLFNPDTVVGGSQQAEVNGSTATEATVTLETNTATRYIPVGSRFTYTWTFVDKEGAKVVTPQREFVFLDGRYQWHEKTVGTFTVYWYGDNASNADLALQAAASSTADNEKLLSVKLNYPIRLVVWRRESEGELAQQSRGAAFDRQVITGGARVAPDVVHLYDPIGGFADVVRHEVAHIVTKVAGDGAFGRLPSWLDEGTAVYAQREPGLGYRSAIDAGIRSDGVTRLRGMTSAANQASKVDLFYGQSWSTVKFMVDKYGQPKFADLFKTFKAGGDMDAALKQVYGVDQDGLYNQWRESVGLKPIDFPPEASTSAPQAQGTRAPLGIGAPGTPGSAAPGGAGDGASTSSAEKSSMTVPAIIVGVVTLLLAAGMGFGALRLMKRKA
ncbi:MAG: hypothetical protein EPO65_10050 [Dehalococcoidia bacterium]|nr:MAG: hypothetical protein EPO65_10050 [Dehalococcoidia bacterium]